MLWDTGQGVQPLVSNENHTQSNGSTARYLCSEQTTNRIKTDSVQTDVNISSNSLVTSSQNTHDIVTQNYHRQITTTKSSAVAVNHHSEALPGNATPQHNAAHFQNSASTDSTTKALKDRINNFSFNSNSANQIVRRSENSSKSSSSLTISNIRDSLKRSANNTHNKKRLMNTRSNPIHSINNTTTFSNNNNTNSDCSRESELQQVDTVAFQAHKVEECLGFIAQAVESSAEFLNRTEARNEDNMTLSMSIDSTTTVIEEASEESRKSSYSTEVDPLGLNFLESQATPASLDRKSSIKWSPSSDLHQDPVNDSTKIVLIATDASCGPLPAAGAAAFVRPHSSESAAAQHRRSANRMGGSWSPYRHSALPVLQSVQNSDSSESSSSSSSPSPDASANVSTTQQNLSTNVSHRDSNRRKDMCSIVKYNEFDVIMESAAAAGEDASQNVSDSYHDYDEVHEPMDTSLTTESDGTDASSRYENLSRYSSATEMFATGIDQCNRTVYQEISTPLKSYSAATPPVALVPNCSLAETSVPEVDKFSNSEAVKRSLSSGRPVAPDAAGQRVSTTRDQTTRLPCLGRDNALVSTRNWDAFSPDSKI